MRRVSVAVVSAIAAGNLAIVLAHLIARRRLGLPSRAPVAVPNALVAAPGLWRSGRPSADGYRSLARAGVRLVVDLRAEGEPDPPAGSKPRVVSIPIPDGRAPTPEAVAHLRREVAAACRPVLIHCSAGVGRTSSMIAAVEVLDLGRDPCRVAVEALAIGPPSLEQIVFMLRLGGGARRPPLPAVWVSRVWDGPRRMLSRVRAQRRRQR